MATILLAFFLLISGDGLMSPVNRLVEGNGYGDSTNVLIVCLSRTGNTWTIAEIIHNQVGGTLVTLELEKPYPKEYRATVDQVVKENATGFLPPLKTKIDHIEKYDIIFVGFPTWGMQLPPPIKSFLHQYNLRGKTVIPFNTNDGYGIGSSFETVKQLCPNSKVLDGFSIRGGRDANEKAMLTQAAKRQEAEVKVKEWLERIEVVKFSGIAPAR